MSLLSFLPTNIMATVYKWLAIVGVAAVLTIGGFFYGKHYGDEQSSVVIAKYEEKVTDLTSKLNIALAPKEAQVIVKYITQVIHDKQTGVDNEKASTEVKDVPADTSKPADNVSKFISNGWVSVHDAAAADTTVTSDAAANDTPSTFTAPEALTTISDNYTLCNEYREQVIGLQNYINTYNSTIAAINKKNLK